MEMTETITPTSAWCRAMQRARREGVKPTKQGTAPFECPVSRSLAPTIS
jgi:hypothetical protein